MAFRFRQFKVYSDAKNLHIKINNLVKAFPHSSYYLADQLNRSSLSIVLNIAEGSSKQSDKDFNRYISIALGSVDETVASLDIAFHLNLVSKEIAELLTQQCLQISNQLGGFSKYLKGQKLVVRD